MSHRTPAMTIARTCLLLLCLLTAHTGEAYTISSSAPRLLFNNAAVKADLVQQLADNLAPATRFRDMVLGEIADPGSRYAFQAYFSALMFQVTGTASYAQFAHDMIIAQLVAEEARIGAGQRADIAGDSYLEVGPLLGDMMLTLDWCPTYFTAGERSRIIAYANQTLYNLWNPDLATWGGVAYPWSGWSIDNPANNYYYSFLTATMMTGVATYGANPQAQAWIDRFRSKIDQLDIFFDSNLAGGGSQEGTGYGTAMMNLFRVYYYWEKSTGENIADRSTHALNSTYWFVQATTPGSHFLAPTGDHARDSTAALYDYHRSYLLALLKLHPTDAGARVGKSLLGAAGITEMANSMNYWSDYLYNQPAVSGLPLSTLSTAFYDPNTGVFATRSDWTDSATYLYQVAGPYTESHAHRDQGSFVLWKGGWLFDDENIRSHSGIEQNEWCHNLVRFATSGGVITQSEGGPETQMLAVADNAIFSYTSCDTLPAYDAKPEVVTSQRELLFIKPGCLVVYDRADANSSGVSRVFGLNMSTTPVIAGSKLTLSTSGNSAECWRLAPTGVPWTTTTYPVADFPSGGVRAEAAHASGTASRFLHVIGINADVAAVSASNTATETGASITFADGRTATVRFTIASPGGTLDLRSAGGATIHNATLPTTVVKPTLTSSPDTIPPVLSAISAGSITASGATITWTTDEAASTRIEYGPTAAYGSLTTLAAALVTSHSQTLGGLAAGTTYHYRVISSDASANQAVSSDRTFTTSTSADTTPPVLSAINASPVTATAATITWTTDEAASGQVEYGTTAAYGSSSTLVATLGTAHSSALSGLTPSTTYHYRVKSSDASANQAVSTDRTFTTLAGSSGGGETNGGGDANGGCGAGLATSLLVGLSLLGLRRNRVQPERAR